MCSSGGLDSHFSRYFHRCAMYGVTRPSLTRGTSDRKTPQGACWLTTGVGVACTSSGDDATGK